MPNDITNGATSSELFSIEPSALSNAAGDDNVQLLEIKFPDG